MSHAQATAKLFSAGDYEFLKVSAFDWLVLRGDVNELRGELWTLRERMAHLEGLMEGLREAIVGRAKAS